MKNLSFSTKSKRDSYLYRQRKAGSIIPLVCIDYNNQYKWPVFTRSGRIMCPARSQNVTVKKELKWREIKHPGWWR